MTISARPVTLCEAFQRTAAIDPGAVALRTPGGTQTMTWHEYATQVRQVAAGLAALGVRRGDTVSLMMANRIEFYPLEVGAQHVGATSFSVYNTLPAEQLAYAVRQRGHQGGDLRGAVRRTHPRQRCGYRAHRLHRRRAGGQRYRWRRCTPAAIRDFDFESTWRAVRPDDVVTLIYTSGTTGNPKGVEMTHANLLFEAFALDAVLGIQFGDRTHVVSCRRRTSPTGCAASTPRRCSAPRSPWCPTARDRGRAARRAAHRLGRGPRVWEKLKAAIEFTVSHETDHAKRQALEWAMSVAAKRAAALSRR